MNDTEQTKSEIIAITRRLKMMWLNEDFEHLIATAKESEFALVAVTRLFIGLNKDAAFSALAFLPESVELDDDDRAWAQQAAMAQTND